MQEVRRRDAISAITTTISAAERGELAESDVASGAFVGCVTLGVMRVRAPVRQLRA